ncbi:thaumatin [Suillus spraguei]|nr:thaumatin [Suillus spraguei]
MATISALVLAAIMTVVQAQSLNVVNSCSEPVFLFTQTDFGSIDNNVTIGEARVQTYLLAPTGTALSTSVSTGCNDNGSTCTTGGPTWDGSTPFSRAEFNFYAIPGSVTYDISVVYGYNVGMQISSANSSCDAFACTISSAVPFLDPERHLLLPVLLLCERMQWWRPCYCGGTCLDNEGSGPNSPFYYETCYNAYTFPDNDGADSSTSVYVVTYTCGNTNITLTLCPDVRPSDYTS